MVYYRCQSTYEWRCHDMSTATQNPLTRAVKRFLDFLRVIVFISLILWPLFVVAMTIGQYSDPETWGVDIGVFSGFIIDLNVFAGDITESVGVRDPEISGKGMLNIDTSSLYALICVHRDYGNRRHSWPLRPGANAGVV